MEHREESGPEKLKRWRTSELISQAAAAERLGIAQSLYSEWETSKKTPGILNLGKIRAITGISLEAWLPEELRAPPANHQPQAKHRPTRRPPAAA